MELSNKSPLQIAYSKVRAIEEELYNGNGLLPDYFGSGSVPDLHTTEITPALLTAKTNEVISLLQLVDVSKYSEATQNWLKDNVNNY
jgi:hypothetical protein